MAQDIAGWPPPWRCSAPRLSRKAPKPAPTPTTPLDAVQGEITPGAKPTAPPRSLSDKLNSSNGVIPPAEVDPAIERPASKTQDPNVLPPPGTSGGALAPQAK